MTTREVVILCGPPFVGRTLYTKRRLPADFARADTEEYHKKGGNNTNARSWHKHMYGESLEHPHLVIDGRHGKGDSRDGLVNYLKEREPGLSVRMIHLEPRGGRMQCQWAWQWALAEQAIRDKGRSRLEDPGAWFAEYHSGPVTRRHLEKGETEVLAPLVFDSAYRPTTPALFVELVALAPNMGDDIREPIVSYAAAWCKRTVTGRLIVIGRPTSKEEKEHERKEESRRVCEQLSRACGGRPVYFIVWEDSATSKFVYPPNPGYIAWLQRRHLLNLWAPETEYVACAGSSQLIAAEKASVFAAQADRIMDGRPHPQRQAVKDWLRSTEVANISYQESSLEEHVPLFATALAGGYAEEAGPWLTHGVVAPDKDELDLYDNECHNAAEKASVPTPPEHLPTQPTQAMETPVQSTGAPTVPPKNTTSSGDAARDAAKPATAGAKKADADKGAAGSGSQKRIGLSYEYIHDWVGNNARMGGGKETMELVQEFYIVPDEEDSTGDTFVAHSKCEHSARNNEYYEQTLHVLAPKDGAVITSYKCTCPFAKGVCKHVVAMLLKFMCPGFKPATRKHHKAPPRPVHQEPKRITFDDVDEEDSPSPKPRASHTEAGSSGKRAQPSGDKHEEGSRVLPLAPQSTRQQAPASHTTPLRRAPPAEAETPQPTTAQEDASGKAVVDAAAVPEKPQAAPPAATGLQPANGNAAANPAQARPPSATKPRKKLAWMQFVDEDDVTAGKVPSAGQAKTVKPKPKIIHYHIDLDELKAFARTLAPAPQPAQPEEAGEEGDGESVGADQDKGKRRASTPDAAEGSVQDQHPSKRARTEAGLAEQGAANKRAGEEASTSAAVRGGGSRASRVQHNPLESLVDSLDESPTDGARPSTTSAARGTKRAGGDSLEAESGRAAKHRRPSVEHRSSYQETQPLDSLGSNSGLSQQPAPRPAKPNLFESVRAQQTKPTAVASTAAPASQQRRTGSRTEMPQQSDYKSVVRRAEERMEKEFEELFDFS